MASAHNISAFAKRFLLITTSSSYSDNMVEDKKQYENDEGIFTPPVMTKTTKPLMAKTGSIIAEDLIIDGSVSSSSDITIHGIVNGDVASSGSVSIDGKVTGSIRGVNIEICDCEINGDVTAEFTVTLNESGCINGAIQANQAIINGMVTGNITINGNLNLKKSAVIAGDISSKSMSVDEGAVINGRISIAKATSKP